MPPPSAGRGKRTLPAHRRPAAVRRGIVNRRKLYVFSTKNGKRKVGLFPLKGKKPSCIRGEKNGIIIFAVRPGGRCRCLFTGQVSGVAAPETAAFFVFGLIVTIFVENSRGKTRTFVTFGRPGCLPLPRCPRAAFLLGFSLIFGRFRRISSGDGIDRKNRRATLRLVG